MSVSQYYLTRFLEDQDTEEGQEINDYGESSTGGKLLYFLFGLIWMCLICQLAGMLKARERREREYTARAAERVEMDQIQKNEQWRAKLQSLFVQREVVRKIEAAHLKPDPEQQVVEEREDTPVATSLDLGESREDTKRYPIYKEEEPTLNDLENPVKEDTTMINVDLKPEAETSSTAAAAAIVHDVDLESGMLSWDDQNQHGILELPEYPVSSVCAICLDVYKAGEMVVWSSNAECQHAFHQDCILDYFANLKDHDKTPCPCCRQDFVEPVKKLHAK